jgi:hypothetical protein
MSMIDRMNELSSELLELAMEDETEDQALPEGWTATGRESRGRPVFVAYAICVAKKTRNIVRETLKRLSSLDASTFKVGKTCPTCHGTGYIPCFGHVAGGICYKCNDPTTTGGGKGYISAQDKAYNDARIKAGTLCDVVAA